jgi:hypothetical protein
MTGLGARLARIVFEEELDELSVFGVGNVDSLFTFSRTALATLLPSSANGSASATFFDLLVIVVVVEVVVILKDIVRKFVVVDSGVGRFGFCRNAENFNKSYFIFRELITRSNFT